ncbi:unnamed protein product [Phytophthora fragariaefolia]|uniref:Unnamed protein product n=1 Tax=Phytophthora fragariaefolia TaxID=1490495 RepID=A0A9W6XWD6_9STRA|nr:unnamed protein product [Phytophthora fragariaefolia]
MSLVDDGDLLMEPAPGSYGTWPFNIMRPSSTASWHISHEDVRTRHISQAEYMIGYYHQLHVNMVPSSFNAVWTAVAVPHGQPASEAVQRLATDLVVSGTPSVSTVDLSTR